MGSLLAGSGEPKPGVELIRRALAMHEELSSAEPGNLNARLQVARGWHASLSYTYVVSLADMGEQWERVDQNLKRLIRRCERDGEGHRRQERKGSTSAHTGTGVAHRVFLHSRSFNPGLAIVTRSAAACNCQSARQAGATTQAGNSRDSVARGNEPWPSTASWKVRTSKSLPSRNCGDAM